MTVFVFVMSTIVVFAPKGMSTQIKMLPKRDMLKLISPLRQQTEATKSAASVSSS